MKRGIVVITMVLVGCGNPTSLSGKELTDAETRAVDTCNESLQKISNATGYIDPSQSSFTTSESSIDIAWMADGQFGTGAIVCSTDGSGGYVTGYLIDGIQVRP